METFLTNLWISVLEEAIKNGRRVSEGKVGIFLKKIVFSKKDFLKENSNKLNRVIS